jgi:hypothetical protein
MLLALKALMTTAMPASPPTSPPANPPDISNLLLPAVFCDLASDVELVLLLVFWSSSYGDVLRSCEQLGTSVVFNVSNL